MSRREQKMARPIAYALIAISLTLFSGFAHAADQALAKAQLEALIVGKTAMFPDGARASYSKNSAYQFRTNLRFSRASIRSATGWCAFFSATAEADATVT
jgi:hypothetical protein